MSRACPVCRSRAAEPLVTLALVLADGHPLGDRMSFASCLECGTGFATDDVSQAAYDRHYEQDAKYADDGKTNATAGEADAADTPWNVARQQLTALRLAGPAALVPTAARLLDIGCATGSLLVALADQGMTEVVGLDPSPAAAAVAASRGARVLTGTLAALPSGLETFDAITMNGVLEHLWDLDGALATVGSLLRPGGLLYVEVPDAARYCHPYVAPFQDFNTEHVNHFSAATLDQVLSRFGFEREWHGDADAELAAGFPSPTTAGSWRFTGRRRAAAPVRDAGLVDELTVFTARSVTELAALDAEIDRLLGQHRAVIGWGVGELAYKLLAMPALARRGLVQLVDGNAGRRGSRLRGVDVVGPSAIEPGPPIVILSLLAEDSIRRGIASAGLQNPVIGLGALL